MDLGLNIHGPSNYTHGSILFIRTKSFLKMLFAHPAKKSYTHLCKYLFKMYIVHKFHIILILITDNITIIFLYF